MQQHYRGQLDNSRKTDNFAKKWTICGIVSGVIYVSLIFLIVAASYAVAYGVTLSQKDGDGDGDGDGDDDSFFSHLD